jgi:3-oxoacyl-[acyl-carrier protein] reductase
VSAGRQALIFGGTGYVGEAILRALGARGVRATFTYRRKRAQAEALAAELGHEARACDLRDGGEVRALTEGILAGPRPPDLFVHAATIGGPTQLSEVTDAQAEEVYAVNVRSALAACRVLLPAWAARGGGGDVVLFTYVDGAHPTPMPAHFALTQGAVTGLARALAKEFGPRDVRVNAVQVGPLEDGVARDLPLPLLDDFERLSAIGRAGRADDIARAVTFLALENRYMTGQVFPVQGGL